MTYYIVCLISNIDVKTSQSDDRLDSRCTNYEVEDGTGQSGHGRIHIEKI